MRHLTLVGAFSIETPRLVISDPHDFDRCIIERAAVGEWRAFIERVPTKAWGERIATLIVAHSSMADEPLDPHWMQTGIRVGNATGIIGIWSERGFVAHGTELLGRTPDVFRAACAAHVNSTELRAGVMDGGVVAASGIGDGNYVVKNVTTIAGDVVAALVDFTSDQNDPIGIQFASETTAHRWKGNSA
jgi:hypothetical protein